MIGPDKQPDLWEYKEHTGLKHAILSNYLKRWISILGRPRAGKPKTMHFVDSYAGRARYKSGELGSPILSMEVGEELHRHFNGAFFLECHNVERDAFNFASLRWEVEVAKQDFPSVGVRNYQGSFEDRAGEIFSNIGAGEPALVFLDPFGYQSIDMPLKMLDRRRNEVFITFMSSFVNRFLTDPSKAAVMDRIFGTPRWRELRGVPNRQERLVRLYCEQIQIMAREKLGVDEVLVYPIDVDFEGRDADIYHLVHVSQHEAARKAMEEAVWSANVLKDAQLSLPLPDAAVEDLILEELGGGRTLQALPLAKKVWLRHFTATWRDDVRGAVKALEQRGEVIVTPNDPSKKRKVGSLAKEKDWVELRGGGQPRLV
ncbi:three-Cys-motif partner protein TcmP [Rubrobacter tropicus]|uniref:three-Cys-motif partner protein TcmP n=1 Tax=Rubrobacter tropicus TaxID=2653851 RepID=UPI00140C1813|nr:three-Cys-motif partner protein TcmP [Rubrobacter tropicus]